MYRNLLANLPKNSETVEFLKVKKMTCEIFGLVNSGETTDDDSKTYLFQAKRLTCIKHTKEIAYRQTNQLLIIVPVT